MTPGVNQAAVQATDGSGNVRTNVYEFEVGGTTASYTYDGAGFLTGRSEGGHNWGYEWNARGELSRVTKDGSEVARYEYDPLGRRIRKVAQGTTYSYVYDGMDILREARTDGTTYTYIHGPGIDEPLARLDQGGQATYYHADGLGSIVKMTNAAGQAVHEYRYDEWGNIQQGGEVGGYAFTGREWDPETRLYYYRARYYDPKIGRFPSEDPIGFLGGNINTYAYVWNNPTLFADPTGLAGDIPLSQGWTARLDQFAGAAGRAGFEYHVFNAAGAEVGVAGPQGWIAKHGFSGTVPAGMPAEVANAVRGQVIDQMRRAGMVPPKGRFNITNFLKNLVRPDKANAVALLYCFIFPDVCEDFEEAVRCLQDPSAPGCTCGA